MTGESGHPRWEGQSLKWSAGPEACLRKGAEAGQRCGQEQRVPAITEVHAFPGLGLQCTPPEELFFSSFLCSQEKEAQSSEMSSPGSKTRMHFSCLLCSSPYSGRWANPGLGGGKREQDVGRERTRKGNTLHVNLYSWKDPRGDAVWDEQNVAQRGKATFPGSHSNVEGKNRLCGKLRCS